MQMDKGCTRNLDDIANFTDFVMSSKKDAKIDFFRRNPVVELEPSQIHIW